MTMSRKVSDIDAKLLAKWSKKVEEVLILDDKFARVFGVLVSKSSLKRVEARRLLLFVCSVRVVDAIQGKWTKDDEIDRFKDSLDMEGLIGNMTDLVNRLVELVLFAY